MSLFPRMDFNPQTQFLYRIYYGAVILLLGSLTVFTLLITFITARLYFKPAQPAESYETTENISKAKKPRHE